MNTMKILLKQKYKMPGTFILYAELRVKLLKITSLTLNLKHVCLILLDKSDI